MRSSLFVSFLLAALSAPAFAAPIPDGARATASYIVPESSMDQLFDYVVCSNFHGTKCSISASLVTKLNAITAPDTSVSKREEALTPGDAKALIGLLALEQRSVKRDDGELHDTLEKRIIRTTLGNALAGAVSGKTVNRMARSTIRRTQDFLFPPRIRARELNVDLARREPEDEALQRRDPFLTGLVTSVASSVLVDPLTNVLKQGAKLAGKGLGTLVKGAKKGLKKFFGFKRDEDSALNLSTRGLEDQYLDEGLSARSHDLDAGLILNELD